MIRKNAVAVKIKAPSKGLVTRWPSETADRFYAVPPDLATLQTGMALQRSWAVAQNVRFEDGVIAAAPGYIRCKLVETGSTLLAAVVSHWRMDEASSTRFDAHGSDNLSCMQNFPGQTTTGLEVQATAGILGNAALFDVGPYVATSTSISNGWFYALVSPTDLLSTLTGTWTLTAWINVSATSTISQCLGTFGNLFLLQSGTSLFFVNLSGPTVSGLVAGSWAFVVLSYNASTNVASISINNGVAATGSAFMFGTPWSSSGVYVVGNVVQDLGIFYTCTTNVGPSATHPASDSAHWSVTPAATNWTNPAVYDGVRWGSFTGSNPASFDVDSVTLFNRALTALEITQIYASGSALDYPFITGKPGTLLYESNLIVGSIPSSTVAEQPMIFAAGSQLFVVARSYTSGPPPVYTATLTQIYPPSGAGGATTDGYNWRAIDFFDKIVFAQAQNRPQYSVGGAATSDLPGLVLNSSNFFSSSSDGNEIFEGVETFFGHVLLWRNDLLIWSDLNDFANYVPVGATAVSATLLASTFTQPAIGSTVALTFSNGTVPLAVSQFVRVIDGVHYNYYQVQASPAPTASTCTVMLMGTTGITTPGNPITSPTVTTLNANEAGTSRIVGANVNGPIYQVVALSDYAYIFKNWSIQSLQYVGQASGTFQLRTEVMKEGLLGRNSVVKLVNGGIVFLGHRELYSYNSGSAPQPVCRQYTRQLLAEVDRTRLDDIILIHRDIRNEVWVVYPIHGGQKVLVWNYVEDTATIDVYDTFLLGINAGTRVDWLDDPAWNSGSPDQTWISFAPTYTWASFVGTGSEEVELIATGNFELLVHGTVYDRAGGAYTALGETMDFDFGDNTVFKYIDVIHVGLQTTIPSTQVRNLYVQVGYRPTLDADITWSVAKPIQIQGNANFTAKINPGSGGGRYIRLRFFSQDVDVPWRVSSYEIYGRAGGTY